MQQEGSIGDGESMHLFFFNVFFLSFFFPQRPPHWQKLDATELRAPEETRMVKEGGNRDKQGCDGSQGESGRPHS